MSWYDDKPVYYDKRPGLVKLPHDPLLEDPDKLAKLSGEVVAYKLTKMEAKNHDRDSSRSQTFGRAVSDCHEKAVESNRSARGASLLASQR